jgi:hypothetical protein
MWFNVFVFFLIYFWYVISCSIQKREKGYYVT